RSPRADLHRGYAGLEARRWAPSRRAYRAHRPRRAQGSQVELALLWHRRPGLVPEFSLLHEVRQSGFFPRRVTTASPTGESKQKEVRYLDIQADDALDERLVA